MVNFMQYMGCVCSVVSDSSIPRGFQPARFFYPRDFPGKNTLAGCLFLLQGIFWTQGSNPYLRPSLAGRFFTTATPGKPHVAYILPQFLKYVKKFFPVFLWVERRKLNLYPLHTPPGHGSCWTGRTFWLIMQSWIRKSSRPGSRDRHPRSPNFHSAWLP